MTLKSILCVVALLLAVLYAVVIRISLSEAQKEIQSQQQELDDTRGDLGACRGTFFSPATP